MAASKKKTVKSAAKATKKHVKDKGEVDRDEIKDIARDIEQKSDNEDGVECTYSEDSREIKRLRRSSILDREEEEEYEEYEGYEYEREIYSGDEEEYEEY